MTTLERQPQLGPFPIITDIPPDHPAMQDKKAKNDRRRQNIDFYNDSIAGKEEYAGCLVVIGGGRVIASMSSIEGLLDPDAEKSFWEEVDRRCQELGIDRRFDVFTTELPPDIKKHKRFAPIKLPPPEDTHEEQQQDGANRSYFQETVLLDKRLAGLLVCIAGEQVISTSSAKTELEFLEWMLRSKTQAQSKGAERGFIGFVPAPDQ